MQTKDIKSGVQYAIKRWKFADPECAEVIEPKATGTKQVGFRTVETKGVKVRFAESGVEVVVAPKEVVATWESHVAEKAEADKRRRAAERARKKALAIRAEEVFALSEALLEAGYSESNYENGVPVGYCYDDEMAKYLKAAGFVEVTDPDGYKDYFRSAFYSLHDAMEGKVRLDAALALLKKES